jgi:hypothetical protein
MPLPSFDNMEIEILEDGTIKTTTDAISGPNHSNASEFLNFISRMAGGEETRTKRLDVKRSLHEALHEHAKDGHVHEH